MNRWNWVKFALLLLIPVIIVLIPYSFLERQGTICLSVWLLDVKCYGCGMVRGLVSIAHLEWARAADLNGLAFPVFGLFMWLWVQALYNTLTAPQKKPNT